MDNLNVCLETLLSLSARGQAIAQQIQNANPNLVDQLTGYGGGAEGQPPQNQNGQNPDSSSNFDDL